jgi:hypothetical protein
MVENVVKEALLNAMNRPENIFISYSITHFIDDKRTSEKLVLFYSKDRIFTDKIYIVWIDDTNDHFNIKEPFESYKIELAVDFLFNLYNNLTNSYKDNLEKYNNLIENKLELTNLIIDKRAEILRVKTEIKKLNK